MRPSGDMGAPEKSRQAASGFRGIPGAGQQRRGQWPILAPPLRAGAFLILPLVAILSILRGVTPQTVDLSSYPWLYERGGRPMVGDEATVEVVLVGDVMLGRGVTADKSLFDTVVPWLRAADLAVANLECVVGEQSPRSGGAGAEGGPGQLQAPPSAVGLLRGAGFDILSVANNHALDLGSQGLQEMCLGLERAGLTTIGAGPDPVSAIKPLILDIRGIRLAFIAVNAVPDRARLRSEGPALARWDPASVQASVRTASEQADAVIVFVHWGYEYERRVDPAQQRAADLLLDAGADLIVGHHPHVVQPCGIDETRFVAYSLGNFVFDQHGKETGRGLALRTFIDKRGLRAVQALPILSGPHPELMSVDQARAGIPRIGAPRELLSFRCTRTACRTVAALESASGPGRSGVFWGGSVDLTGDGVREHVRRVKDRAIIYSDGAIVWRSPVDWRVVDLAVGDPNVDGRRELMLALWKPGLDGLEPLNAWDEQVPRSRPFIVGYRGGIYRTLWGGSAVRCPILEVELGDVDRDGVEELIVLEAFPDDPAMHRIAVWRWHGWGFSLVWRSRPDTYSDLTVSEAGRIQVFVE